MNLTNVEATAVLTAIKRASVGNAQDRDILANLEKIHGTLTDRLKSTVDTNDIYSLELLVRQALIKIVSADISADIVVDMGCGLSTLGSGLIEYSNPKDDDGC